LPTYVALFVGGLIAVWYFMTKVVYPWWAGEMAKQREHDRQQAEARAAAEQSEEVALWSQMVQLQTRVLDQNSLLLDFLITLATERSDTYSKETQEKFTAVTGKMAAIQHEIRELRTSISILVHDAANNERDREALKKVPAYLLEIQSRQQEFFREVRHLIQPERASE
jgi:signal transduction histidine kinase